MKEYTISAQEFTQIIPSKRHGIYVVEDYGTFYYIDGKYHRSDGPAMVCKDGRISWFLNGKRHRMNGPAREWSNNSFIEYYINDVRFDKKDYEQGVIDYYMKSNGLESYK